jgi:4-hydroxy-3-methylbut-2-en-1-yl diphosphate synthase IspG/GcpE
MIKTILLGAMLYTSPNDSGKITNYEYKINEMILTIEDLHEWIRNDVDNGSLDPRLGEIYQKNYEQLIKDLNELKVVQYPSDFIPLRAKALSK